MKDYLPFLIWFAVIGAVFTFAWKQGQLARLAAYVAATQQELKKCNWPSREELIQSTVLIFVVIGLLGIFTMGTDQIVVYLVERIIKPS
ncbi:MAG: preprotein translocase subunit SecE [Verrucomicrobium sp.]|nr:preprotein translocase subunit SecE [Verrucomicrobium sp.]